MFLQYHYNFSLERKVLRLAMEITYVVYSVSGFFLFFLAKSDPLTEVFIYCERQTRYAFMSV